MIILRNLPLVLLLVLVSIPFWATGGITHAQAATLTPTPSPAWMYYGPTGPEHWGDLSASYNLCATGQSQSPIDIPDVPASASETDLELQFNYQPGPLTLENSIYSIQVDSDGESTLVFDQTTYVLRAFRFHFPSEHLIQGKRYPMELQLEHQDAQGQWAMVSVLIEPQKRTNRIFRGLWGAIGSLTDTPWTLLGVSFNAADLLPDSHDYYTYVGSLTTPPCMENVRWIVLQDPIGLSDAQIHQFTDHFPMSARPVQPLNDREVAAYVSTKGDSDSGG